MERPQFPHHHAVTQLQQRAAAGLARQHPNVDVVHMAMRMRLDLVQRHARIGTAQGNQLLGTRHARHVERNRLRRPLQVGTLAAQIDPLQLQAHALRISSASAAVGTPLAFSINPCTRIGRSLLTGYGA